MEWFEILKFEYVINGSWLFMKWKNYVHFQKDSSVNVYPNTIKVP